MPAPEHTFEFTRAQRLTRAPDIERLLRSGRRVPSRMFDVKRLDSEHQRVRVAIVVPKFGRTAVERNKLKRRVRELTRQHLLPSPTACDVVLRARRESYAASFAQLRDDIVAVAGHLA